MYKLLLSQFGCNRTEQTNIYYLAAGNF